MIDFSSVHRRFLIYLLAALTVLPHASHAHEKKVQAPGDHAPIGVMGDHMHKAGEIMLSYRAAYMQSKGLIDGSTGLTATEAAAARFANRFSSTAGQPTTLRVFPNKMTMEMHMVGAMAGVTDWLTLTAMGSWVEKDMEMTVFQGGAAGSTTILGMAKTGSEGWGDTKLNAIWRLYQTETDHVHMITGLSLPTGSITERDTMLAPSGMLMNMRLPYGMQLGTGTYDLTGNLTYTGRDGDLSWGAQISGRVPLEDENDEGYKWGPSATYTNWGAYDWADWISTSLRLTYKWQDGIDGIDSTIIGPSTGADPDNYGGQSVYGGLGVNFIVPRGLLAGNRLAVEASMPLWQKTDGLQLERDYMITAGWQYAF